MSDKLDLAAMSNPKPPVVLEHMFMQIDKDKRFTPRRKAGVSAPLRTPAAPEAGSVSPLPATTAGIKSGTGPHLSDVGATQSKPYTGPGNTGPAPKLPEQPKEDKREEPEKPKRAGFSINTVS